MTRFGGLRWGGIVGLATLLSAVIPPTEGAAQIGAITEALGGRTTGENVYQRAPVLTESGYCLDQGHFSGAVYFLAGFLSENDTYVVLEDNFGNRDHDRVDTQIEGYRLFLSGLYGLHDRITVGLVGYPYIRYNWDYTGTRYPVVWDRIDASETGFGDLTLYSKLSLWRSKRGWSGIAAFGTLSLPTGGETVGEGTMSAEGGLAASHKIDRWIFHADGAVELPLEDQLDAFGEKAQPIFSFAGAMVFDAHPRLGVSLEGLGSYSDGDFVFDAAPGARLRIGKGVFADGTFLINLTSPEFTQFDYQIVMGLSVIL